ncbi:hypothetical protein HU200_016058 [Digitaria exilis]|uniref:DUF4220 domain-containing protein n=1 Tax=Digitaria exilis TaxID=1010633 RepID=A0A835F8T6_9POAL|nr:hypothetical protein HU200_016058 [Digitaria exilis]
MLAIIATFFHTAIVSCRRWSNRWIVQKGSLIANAVSLSLGPYIIGVMQSTSIRSEMYPIWAVSLYILFGCVDPVTSYTGLDYKGPLSKMVYQICFHCGYALLMVISTMSSNIGKTTIGMLSAITFIKGFHTSLALLIRCWTSNWARVALACKVAREQKKTGQQVISLTWWMRLREFMVTRTDMFDWYPWQNKLGQYSLATEATRSDSHYGDYLSSKIARMLGLDYIWEVLLDLLGSDTKKGAAIMLDYDVKASIIHFLEQVNSDEDVLEKNHWTCFLADANLLSVLGVICVFGGTPPALVYTNWVMMWHVVTCYCELAEQDKKAAAESAGEEREKNRRVATALSKYCAYLVTSVPDLLPGPTTDTKSQYDRFADAARKQLACWEGLSIFDQCSLYFKNGKGMVDLAKQLLGDEASSPPRSSTDPWTVLAGVWVRLLAYGTVDSRAEAHMRHLSLGGELITHLWAFMHHLDIKLSIDDLERYVSRPLLPHLFPFSVR